MRSAHYPETQPGDTFIINDEAFHVIGYGTSYSTTNGDIIYLSTNPHDLPTGDGCEVEVLYKRPKT